MPRDRRRGRRGCRRPAGVADAADAERARHPRVDRRRHDRAGRHRVGSMAAQRGRTIARAYGDSAGDPAGGGKAGGVLNMLNVTSPQRVMLEVKVAEVEDADQPDGQRAQHPGRLRFVERRAGQQPARGRRHRHRLQQGEQQAVQPRGRRAEHRQHGQDPRGTESRDDQRPGSDVPRRRQDLHPDPAERQQRRLVDHAAGRGVRRRAEVHADRAGQWPDQPEGRAGSLGAVADGRHAEREQYRRHVDPAADHDAARIDDGADGRRRNVRDRRADQDNGPAR